MPEEIRKERLNIFLFKEGLSRSDILKKDAVDGLEHAPLANKLTYEGDLYVKKCPSHNPPWLKFVQQGVDTQLTGLAVRSASALIVLTAGERIFAVAFGASRHWIDDTAIERRFGMIVALNSVDPNRLHSVDREEFDTITRTTRSQTSASAAIENFGLDVQRDLVRAVTGKPEDQKFAAHVTGADNLIINAAVTIEGLAEKCIEALTVYGKTTYRERYPWIDNFVRVKDPILVDQLDQLMLAEFLSPETESVFLSPPILLDNQEHGGFRYPREKVDVHEDLRLREFLAICGSKKGSASDSFTVADLQRLKIRYFAPDGQQVGAFRVYESIVYEVTHGECLYALTRGEWFQLDQGYVASVNAEIAGIGDHPTLHLPAARPGEHEGEYNERASNESMGSLALLDKKTIQYGGGRSKMEICDLLGLDRNFIHVKSKTKSQTLSHLFAQGLNSAQAFRDAEFRKLAAQICCESHTAIFPEQPIKPDEHVVTYAVITTAPNSLQDALPFFSRQSLANANRQLKNMGYHVYLRKIPVEEAAE